MLFCSYAREWDVRRKEYTNTQAMKRARERSEGEVTKNGETK